MKYSNIYCLKSLIAIALKIWLWVVNPYIFWSKQEEKTMSILGRHFPSQRKNRSLQKITVQIVMLSFWLPSYLEFSCKPWFYRKKQITIFLGAYIFHWNFVKCWCIQKRYAAKLLQWNDIHEFSPTWSRQCIFTRYLKYNEFHYCHKIHLVILSWCLDYWYLKNQFIYESNILVPFRAGHEESDSCDLQWLDVFCVL